MLILRSLAPLTVEKKPSKKTLAYIDKLQSSEDYKMMVRNRPSSALSLEKHLGCNFAELIFSQGEINIFLQLPGINLFSDKKLTIQDQSVLTYLYDAVVDLRYIKKPSSPLAILATKKQLLQASLYPADLLGILLPFRMSQKELILWIKENWSELKAALSELEPFTPTYIPKNLEIGAEIDEYRKQGLSFKIISDELTKKYPDRERLMDYNQVRSIHQQYREYMLESDKSIKKLAELKSILKHT